MADRPGVMIYVDEVLSACSFLSTEQAGRLFLAVLHYGKEGEIPEWEDPILSVAWSFIQPKLDRDGQKYAERSIKARYATYCREARRADQTPAPFDQWYRSISSDINRSSDDALRYPTVSATASATAPESETETETLTEKTIGADRPPRSPRFVPPPLKEVEAYCAERKNGVDPQRFVDFYASKGWKVGNQSMKDWRAAVRTWEQRDARKSPLQQERTYTMSEVEEMSTFDVLEDGFSGI